jgi:hypothetical protein
MLNIVIPGHCRSFIRALVRKHPDFETFRLANGDFDSRNMTHPILMKAIEQFGFEQAVRDHIAGMVSLKGDDIAEGETDAQALQEPLRGLEATDEKQAMADSVLEPLRPFLSPILLGDVYKALAPIIDLAAKPPVETVRTITVDETGKAIAVASPHAMETGGSTIAKVFGLAKGKYTSHAVSLWNDTSAPDIDPYHVFEPLLLAKVMTAIGRHRNTWLAGPGSSGKSTLPRQIAARTGRGFVEIAFNRAVETIDLIGSMALDGKGGMRWADGVLTQAIRRPGTIILLDEPTFAPPGIMAVLQTLLSSRSLTIQATGERVPVADGVCFVLADNTAGYGDDSGVYAGTQTMNSALIDRMARVIRVDYLDAALECQALVNHTGGDVKACRMVVDFVNGARKLPGFENRPMGLRRMVAFVEMAQDGFMLQECFGDTFLTRLPDGEREALKMHYRANFNESDFNKALGGDKPGSASASPSNAPEQVAARAAFPEYDGN